MIAEDRKPEGIPGWVAWSAIVLIIAAAGVFLAPAFFGFRHSRIPPNERGAIGWCRSLVNEEAVWKFNDRDRNGVNDYWVADVSGMNRLADGNGNPLAVIPIDVARADAEPFHPEGGVYYDADSAVTLLPMKNSVFGGAGSSPVAKSGYFFAALKTDENGNPYIPTKDTDGKGLNANNLNKFGFVAYPEVYQTSGINTFIVNEAGTVWKKDTGGKEVRAFPKDPAAEGWSMID